MRGNRFVRRVGDVDGVGGLTTVKIYGKGMDAVRQSCEHFSSMGPHGNP